MMMKLISSLSNNLLCFLAMFSLSWVQLVGANVIIHQDLELWMTVDDSVSPTGTSCFHFQTRHGTQSIVDASNFDYFKFETDKWADELLKFNCAVARPDFSNQMYLTFMAKIEGTSPCTPYVTISGGGWSACGYNGWCTTGSIPVIDEYVDHGKLVDYEWRRVAIPLDDYKTDVWKLTNVVQIGFGRCSTSNSQPTWNVGQVKATNYPISLIGAAPETPAPTAAPTSSTWDVWTTVEDSIGSDGVTSCFHFQDRLGTSFVSATAEGGTTFDYFTTTPDAWVGELIDYDRCPPKPDFSKKLYLTFLAKIEGNYDTSTCQPRISLTGGSCGTGYCSTSINLNDADVDAGSVVDYEWRRVVITLEDLKANAGGWQLNGVRYIGFNSCGTDHSVQPTYNIAQLQVTDQQLEVISHPPSAAPTAYWHDDLLLATHRMVHHHWYPILSADREPTSNVWVVAQNNEWPSLVDPTATGITVHIPKGQNVIYSGTDITVYDKIVVEGSLTIQPDNADVYLTAGTIVVDGMMGTLNINTDNSAHTVTIEIDGAIDLATDPEQVMVGLLSLGGNLNVTGNPTDRTMAEITSYAIAGSSTIGLEGDLSGFAIGGELVLPDTQTGLNTGHYAFPNCNGCNYVDQTEICTIQSIAADNVVTCSSPLVYSHSVGSNVAYITRSITIKTSESSIDRGHILGTGMGKFVFANTRVENLGRTTTQVIDNTVMTPESGYKFPTGMVRMNVTAIGTNQLARYALHTHHSMAECYFTGNAILYSPRNGIVPHNSRGHILDNVIVGADGTAIFLEDGTETGPVLRNYMIGTGGGSRGGDDGRFSTSSGLDMGHGGFGIWARGKLSLIQDNHAEGHFGRSPYAFFVHPNFLGDKRVPNVPGTPPELVGLTAHEIGKLVGGEGLQLQTYGGFVNNTAVGTFQVGLDFSYFGTQNALVGSIIEGANIRSLASSGMGLSTVHTNLLSLHDVTIEGTVADNTITGIWCNNCNGCTLQTPNVTLVVENVGTVRGGNC